MRKPEGETRSLSESSDRPGPPSPAMILLRGPVAPILRQTEMAGTADTEGSSA